MRRSTSFGMWISRTSHIIMCDCDSLQDWSNSAIKVVITKSAMSQTMALSNCKLTTSSCFPKQGSSHPNPTHQAARYKTNNTLTNRLPRVQRHVHNNHQSSLKFSLFLAFKSRTHTPSRRMCNPQSYVISGTSASRPLACIFRLVYTLLAWSLTGRWKNSTREPTSGAVKRLPVDGRTFPVVRASPEFGRRRKLTALSRWETRLRQHWFVLPPPHRQPEVGSPLPVCLSVCVYVCVSLPVCLSFYHRCPNHFM